MLTLNYINLKAYSLHDSDSYGTNFNYSITSSDNGTYSDSLNINSFDKVRINIDSNSNDSASTFSIKANNRNC